MTSCPSEEDLVLLVEDGADAAPEAAAHLAECEACRRLLGRSEAALRFALGGLADEAAASPVLAPAAPRRLRFVAAAAAVLVAAALGGVALLDAGGDRGDVAAAPPTVPGSPEARIDALLAAAERLAAPVPEDDDGADVALAALAAAEARVALGMPTAAARLRDVVDAFPGTAAAREARARIDALEGGAR
jgi:hypothetical protein